jgi:hypothetical protein
MLEVSSSRSKIYIQNIQTVKNMCVEGGPGDGMGECLNSLCVCVCVCVCLCVCVCRCVFLPACVVCGVIWEQNHKEGVGRGRVCVGRVCVGGIATVTRR